jgi:hypothetical protein
MCVTWRITISCYADCDKLLRIFFQPESYRTGREGLIYCKGESAMGAQLEMCVSSCSLRLPVHPDSVLWVSRTKAEHASGFPSSHQLERIGNFDYDTAVWISTSGLRLSRWLDEDRHASSLLEES